MSKDIGIALPKKNYVFIIAGVVLALIGFMLMSGGGAEDPNVFEKDELFSSRRITVAPFMVILGYLVVLYGILKRPNVQVVANANPTAKNTDAKSENEEIID